ncbi:uncharacterized protein [Oryza sativa Japonica Group]|jgi:hypothetical protein|uniref:Os06g0714700 protein n=5 Tax=Oryza TaxID=4527 RepID=Q0D9I2_ORYSJ|nr:uncharacterized protein LOC4342064 [Oryza sativa Japonica Group]EAZ02351.1 hypothetical protein OsI_24455 [Oryza sativa Indica Group]KAB8103869.1 hypothetical protein EE612_036468 [Oryza sativa]KAF2928486.1 hypothetical protein DAI22_06g282000 [Oryza sativa Japonica Group]BAD53567.1 hypothetical protein [Oryza sativa Japonica Group]BAF20491.1 Os06g0714700 [Oryza sativa Japonica Group]|eukprot:NP_001058577.1 Os06g0714700 [Oryza sativa Japonica Group]
MDAAVSLHLHGALPLPASRALHHLNPASSAAAAASAKQHQQPRARLAVTTARPSSRTRARAAAASAPPVPPVVHQQHRLSSSRAATGYAAALADASLRAGTLASAARHARALLVSDAAAAVDVAEDSRVVALVRMLVGKGKAAMVADVMAEFVAICDRLLLLPARPHAATSY